MKNYLILFSLVFVLFSCKNQEDNNEPDDIQSTEQENDGYSYPDSRKPDSRSETPEDDGTSGDRDNKMETPNSVKDDDTEVETQGRISNSKYVKVDENNAGCSCYCVDVVPTGQTELCLKQNEIYITARFSQEGNTTLIYFTEPSAKNTNDELPWDDFDTGTPIAEITPTAEGMELDWKGFSINGELAVDYAIYGKKSLEGAYIKQ